MTKKVQLNFLITLLSQELPLIPNEVSSIVDEIRDLFVVLIQWNYFLCKFLSERAINKRVADSVFISTEAASIVGFDSVFKWFFFVTTIL